MLNKMLAKAILQIISLCAIMAMTANTWATQIELPPAVARKLSSPEAAANIKYPENIEDVIRLKKYADRGYAQANYIMGMLYSDTRLKEGERNDERGRYYLNKALDHYPAHPHALFFMGVMYGDGLGVKKDPEKSVEYYKKAGAAGNVKGFKNLAAYYMHKVKPRDARSARFYLEQAAHLGDAEAADLLENWDYLINVWLK